MLEKILRPIFILLFSILGIVLFSQSDTLVASMLPYTFLSETILGVTFLSLGFMLIGAVVGGLVGNLASPFLIRSLFAFTSWAEKSLSAISTQDLVLGTAGLFLGLIIANLVGIAFDRVPYIGPVRIGGAQHHSGISRHSSLHQQAQRTRELASSAYGKQGEG